MHPALRTRRHRPAPPGWSLPLRGLGWALCLTAAAQAAQPPATDPDPGYAAPQHPAPGYQVHPIGWVRKDAGRTVIEVEERYRPALLGVDALRHIWVLYWFDRNDNPAQRAILQVHPRGNPENPLRGVFATRAPVRPNLIALSRCRVIAVEGNIIEIDGIDAFPDTPVLDIKP